MAVTLLIPKLTRIMNVFPKTTIIRNIYASKKIGKREIVGPGWNGSACYTDRLDFPFPSVRFREDNEEIACLREKEKGDWRDLNDEAKRALYRASFCQTFAEMGAFTGIWKQCVGSAIWAILTAYWVLVFYEYFVYDELPESFKEENKKAQLRRMIALEVNPITGLCSKWDYEKDTWKD